MLAKISEDLSVTKIHSKAGVSKNISLKLHSKGGVGKNVKMGIFANYMFLGTPALKKCFFFFLYQCFYPQQSRESVFPVCEIFKKHKVVMSV